MKNSDLIISGRKSKQIDAQPSANLSRRTMWSKRVTEYWKYSEYIFNESLLMKHCFFLSFDDLRLYVHMFSHTLMYIVPVFYEQRDSVLEQHQTSIGIFTKRTIPRRHKHYHVEHERRSDQSVQPSDPRIVGSGR